jgi:hypothetical protein
MTEFIELCGHKMPVVAQKHARLRHHLSGEDFNKILSKDYSTESYRVLSILIPALPDAVPEHVWEGFSTKEKWESYQRGNRDEYNEDEDNSPTPDDIAGAFELALNVNGANRLGKLLRIINSSATLVGQQTRTSSESPGENGVSQSTPTGTNLPT